MKIVPPEPSITLYEDGFDERDLLQRKRLGDALSDLLGRTDDPLVIALDGKWGTGKTYLLKRWVGAHSRENGRAAAVVYFDAFAHDSLGDPLPALVSALEERITQLDPDSRTGEREKNVRALKAATYKLLKVIARAGLAGSGGAVVLQVIDELARARTKVTADPSEAFWKDEESRRVAMEEFRKAIKALAASEDVSGTGSTVVIVVDELDRCRPDYALAVLEMIKHFFAVPRLHFVLGVNLSVLEDMVRARYGSGIDANAYLAKFIQVKLELPEEFRDRDQQKRAALEYLDHLIECMGVLQHIAGPLREQVDFVARSNHVSLRAVGNIVSSVSLANGDVVENPEGRNFFLGRILVMIDLIVSRIVRPDLYPRFLDATVTRSDLESYFGATMRAVEERLNGQGNPDFDPDLAERYYLWIYLSHDGRVGSDAPEALKRIPGLFSDHGSRTPRSPQKLPKEIHRRWLDLFSYFPANQ